jgi:hypothetical protein
VLRQKQDVCHASQNTMSHITNVIGDGHAGVSQIRIEKKTPLMANDA